MSSYLIGLAFKTIDLSRLSPSEALLLVAYSDTCHDDGNGYLIWASDEFMQHKTGVALRTIQDVKRRWRDLGVLVPAGFIDLASKKVFFCDVSIQGSGGRGWAVVYRFTLDPFARKEEWPESRAKKVAKSATFNPGRIITPASEKVANSATFPDEKVADSASEGRRIAHEKVADSASEGRRIAQRNKEELSVELSGELQEGFRPAKPGLSQSERDSWDLRRWQQAMEASEPQPGAHVGDPDEHWRDRARRAAFHAGLAPERIKELLRQHFPNDPNIDLLYEQQPLFEARA